jgi:hypothetical protein
MFESSSTHRSNRWFQKKRVDRGRPGYGYCGERPVQLVSALESASSLKELGIEQKRLAVRQYDEDRPAIEIMPPSPPQSPSTQSIFQQRLTSSVSKNETS